VKSVILSAAKNLMRQRERSFAALRMTIAVSRMIRRHGNSEIARRLQEPIFLSPPLRVSLSIYVASRNRGYLNKSSVPPFSSAFGFSSVFGFSSLFGCAASEPNNSFSAGFSAAGGVAGALADSFVAAGGAGACGGSTTDSVVFSVDCSNPGGGPTDFVGAGAAAPADASFCAGGADGGDP
jgi:hypothetical protein